MPPSTPTAQDMAIYCFVLAPTPFIRDPLVVCRRCRSDVRAGLQAGSNSTTEETYSPAKVFRVRLRFFAHVFHEPLRRPDLTRSVLFFLHDFSPAKIVLEIWTSSDQIHSAKKIEQPPPSGDQASGWTYKTRVQTFRVYLSKPAWTFGL